MECCKELSQATVYQLPRVFAAQKRVEFSQVSLEQLAVEYFYSTRVFEHPQQNLQLSDVQTKALTELRHQIPNAPSKLT